MGGFFVRQQTLMRGGRHLVAFAAAGVVLAGGLALAISAPAAADPLPAVTLIFPTSGLTTGGTSVHLTGSGFTGAFSVDFGGQAGTQIQVSADNSLTVTSPAEPAGTVDITVTTPAGTSTTSSADQFTYVPPGPAPTITSVSPPGGLTTGGTDVTLTGTGFTGTFGVDFGLLQASPVQVVSDTTIIATTPVEPAGTVNVAVFTPNGNSQGNSAIPFTFVPPGPAPAVTSVSPKSGFTSGGIFVIISGSGFTGTGTVDFGGTSVLFVVNSDTSITAKTPAAPTGTADVIVTTPNGTSPTSPADQFTFVVPGPPPAVTGVSPPSGLTAGGTPSPSPEPGSPAPASSTSAPRRCPSSSIPIRPSPSPHRHSRPTSSTWS